MTPAVSAAFANSSSIFLSPPSNVISGMRSISNLAKNFRVMEASVEVTYVINFMDPTSALSAVEVTSFFTVGRNGQLFSDLFKRSLLLQAHDNATLALYEGVSVASGATVIFIRTPSLQPSTKAPAAVSVVNNVEASTSKSSDYTLVYILVPILGTICIATSIAAYYCINRALNTRRTSMVDFFSMEE